MLGDFITRIIILLVGYAYPAYGCYKSLEKKKPEIQELRYWCKYWILVGILTVFERIGDIIVSWFPLYGEIKIALLICLWYPKSQGTNYVYEKLLCPYMSRHELDIDQGILVLKIRGHSVIVQLFQYGYHWTLHIFRNLHGQFAVDTVESCYGDGISYLPDELLTQILSLLPSKRAASKKRRNLFPMMIRHFAFEHHLQFDDSDLHYHHPEEGPDDARESFRLSLIQH